MWLIYIYVSSRACARLEQKYIGRQHVYSFVADIEIFFLLATKQATRQFIILYIDFPVYLALKYEQNNNNDK